MVSLLTDYWTLAHISHMLFPSIFISTCVPYTFKALAKKSKNRNNFSLQISALSYTSIELYSSKFNFSNEF